MGQAWGRGVPGPPTDLPGDPAGGCPQPHPACPMAAVGPDSATAPHWGAARSRGMGLPAPQAASPLLPCCVLPRGDLPWCPTRLCPAGPAPRGTCPRGAHRS